MTTLPSLIRERVRAEQDRRKRMAAMKEEAEKDFLAFVRMMWPILEPEKPLVEGWLLDALCDMLMAITDGHLTRACINVPPGSTKSTLLNVLFPAWEWGPCNKPHLRYMSLSYSTAVPIRDNLRFIQIIKHPVYQQCWGDRVKLTRDGAEWVGNNKTGWKMVTSTGGGVTGFRGDRLLCFPYRTLVYTSVGLLPIGQIVCERLDVAILGCGATGLVWQAIDGYSESPSDEQVTLTFAGGSVTCTPEHPIWVEGRGWTAASDVRAGEVLWTYSDETLPELWQGDVGQAKRDRMAPELQPCMQRDCAADEGARVQYIAVQDMRHHVLSHASPSPAGSGALLQQDVRREGQYRTWEPAVSRDRAALSVVWQDDDQAKTEAAVLFSGVRVGSMSAGNRRRTWRSARLSALQAGIQGSSSGAEVLRRGVCVSGSCDQDSRQEQRSVSAWSINSTIPAGLDDHVSGTNQGARWERVLSLSDDTGSEWPEALCASHRLRQGQPTSDEHDNSLPLLSRADARETKPTGAVARAVVTSVGRSRCDRRSVYNLQVSCSHTYFANGVLVHNCDDLNNPMDVESDTVRDSTNRFVREILPSRLNDLATSAVINLQQRTHQNDATGTLIEHGQGYTFICVPAEFDPLRIWPVTLRWDEDGNPTDQWVDPRSLDENGDQLEGLTTNERGEPMIRFGSPMAKAEGESFWPERFPEEELHRLKMTMTAYSWDSQFQQFPGVRGGAIIKREWWKLWTGEYPALGTVVVSVDTAIEEKETNDFNAVTAWGAFAGDAGEPLFLLLSAWRARLPLAQLVARIAETCRERKADYLIVEAKTRGRDVHDEIVRLYQDATWQTELVKPQGDKVSRLQAVSHLFSGDVRKMPDGKDLEGKPAFIDVWSGGCIYAPDRDFADSVITEVATFPYSAHDDYVDSVSQALAWVRRNGVILRKVEWDAAELERNKFRRSVGVPYAIKPVD